jgi:hypothetical protein
MILWGAMPRPSISVPWNPRFQGFAGFKVSPADPMKHWNLETLKLG